MKKMRRLIRASFIGCLPAVVLISGCSGQAKKPSAAFEHTAIAEGSAAGRIRAAGHLLFQSAPVSKGPTARFDGLRFRTVPANFLAENQTDSPISEEESLATADLGEIDRKLNNPLTDLWSLSFQNNLNVNKGDAVDGREISNNLFFQPFLPFAVGENKETMLTFRPVFPLVTNPVFGDPGSGESTDHDTGLGDIQLLTLAGPSRPDGWVWGVGATSIFPTATEDTLGSDKYQMGPAGMIFNIGKPWVYGVLVQHWWSYAGDSDAPDTSRTDIQYTIRRSLPDAWSIGMGPTITIDWNADSDSMYTVPVGLGLTKTVRWGKMPVKLRWEAHYSVIRPDDYGNEWVFRFQITPVIPNPFK
ncbi:MAG: hypothetical protein ACYTBJ_21620 [Planctomycetota bacterium]|jgi:hypothetical protein